MQSRWTDKHGKTPHATTVRIWGKMRDWARPTLFPRKGERRLADGLGLQSCRDGIFLSIRVSMDDRQGDTLLLLPPLPVGEGVGG